MSNNFCLIIEIYRLHSPEDRCTDGGLLYLPHLEITHFLIGCFRFLDLASKASSAEEEEVCDGWERSRDAHDEAEVDVAPVAGWVFDGFLDAECGFAGAFDDGFGHGVGEEGVDAGDDLAAPCEYEEDPEGGDDGDDCVQGEVADVLCGGLALEGAADDPDGDEEG